MDLIEAVKNENFMKVKELLDQGSDVNANYLNEIPLIVASKNGNIKIVKLLLDRGANINTKTISGFTPLSNAVTFTNTTSSIEIVKLLLDSGADVNAKIGKPGKLTALSISAGSSNLTSSIETVKLLLDSGADDYSKNTALVVSSTFTNTTSSIETVKLLLDYGADINSTYNDGTALMYTSQNSNSTSSIETVKLLLENGADVNLKNIDGKSSLYISSQNSNTSSSIETVKLLLENGANPFIKNNENKTALDICPTKECQNLISKNMWSRMHKNIKLLSRQYSRSGIARFPKDIWELILLRNKQKQLCKNLSSEENREILVNFALLYEIPVNKDMSKSTLCELVSKQLSYGERYSQRSIEYFKTKDGLKQIGMLAKTLGVNTNQRIDYILNDISTIMMK